MIRLALVALFVPAIAAAKPYVDHSDYKKAGPSGIEGTIDEDTIEATNRAVALQGFKLGTNKGRTCRVLSQAQPLPGRDATDQVEWLDAYYPFERCVEHYNENQHPPTWHEVVRTGNMYVRGVQVCTQATPTTSERSIRGLKVFYARVSDDGKVTPLDDPEVWVNDTGCEKWEERAMCPDGSLAVGYRAHRADWGYRALALRCAAVSSRD